MLVLCAHAALSGEKPATTYILCKSQKVVRTIRVEKDPVDRQCVALYTKEGVDSEVGRAQSMASCEKIVDNIKDNLEGANWKCRKFSGVHITTTKDE